MEVIPVYHENSTEYLNIILSRKLRVFVVSAWRYVQLASVWHRSGRVEFCQPDIYGFESVSILYVSDVCRLDDRGSYVCV